MRFEITHEFDSPLDAIELAVLSPTLGDMLARSLTMIESVETLEHSLEDGALRRVLRFQASVPLGIFKGKNVARDAMSWEETWTYRLANHASTWSIAPKEQWKRFFRSEGTYRLEPMADGRTRRTVVGDLEIRVPMVAGLAERMALVEVRKTYDAEANTLRELATL